MSTLTSSALGNHSTLSYASDQSHLFYCGFHQSVIVCLEISGMVERNNVAIFRIRG